MRDGRAHRYLTGARTGDLRPAAVGKKFDPTGKVHCHNGR